MESSISFSLDLCKAKGLTPSWFIPFALSLWLLGIGLIVLSLDYPLASFRR